MHVSLKRSMCMAALGVLATIGLSRSARANLVLYTTQQDFSGWSDNSGGSHFTGATVATPDSDGSSVNGLGNTTNAGGAGTAGSESITWLPAAGSYNYFYSQGEQGNAPFLSAIDPGSGGGNLVADSGTLLIDFTYPPAGTGNYFQLGLVLNYSSNFGQFFGGAPTGPNAAGFYTEAIPYSINPVTGLSYFQMGIIYNSNYNTATPFNIDNIQVVSVPEPASASLLAVGCVLALRRRRRIAVL